MNQKENLTKEEAKTLKNKKKKEKKKLKKEINKKDDENIYE